MATSKRMSALVSFVVLALIACSTAPEKVDNEVGETAIETPAESADHTAKTKRVFAPAIDGKPITAGISYGPYRRGQKPGGPNPTDDQIREDLNILVKNWNMIRMYGSRGPAEATLRIIKEDNLPIRVMVGAWIAPNDEAANAAEVDKAIELANAYPDEVIAVSIGNESQVFWSGHRTPPEILIKHLKRTRDAIQQPVTTADDYNFWNKPESKEVANLVDFIVLHAYAMWNKQTLEDAVPWTAEIVDGIKKDHPDHKIVIGELGWATQMNPDGNEGQYIKAPAGEREQATFYTAFTTWARDNAQSYFYFSAFDEPWKGSDNPKEVEKHWGLYNEDRTPKPAIQATSSAK